jgi:hypothetical protein
MIPSRRRSSTRVFIIQGVWSVKEDGAYIAEGVTEQDAWKAYLATTNDAELIQGRKVMSRRIGLR